MTPEWWLAHILAVHLSVPEPVSFKLMDLWPMEDVCAVMRMHGEGGQPSAWTIQYDEGCWNRVRSQRAWVIAHEACHGAFDYDHNGWHRLTKRERDRRDKRADECANKIIRDHEANCLHGKKTEGAVK